MTQELLAKQPKPDGVGAGTEIASYLLGYLAHENTSSGFLEAISHRMLTGEVKFGIRLQSGNGRDPYADAFQQSLDTVLSLGQALVEGTGDKGLTTMLLASAIQLSEGILMAANVRRGLEAPEAPVEEEAPAELTGLYVDTFHQSLDTANQILKGKQEVEAPSEAWVIKVVEGQKEAGPWELVTSNEQARYCDGYQVARVHDRGNDISWWALGRPDSDLWVHAETTIAAMDAADQALLNLGMRLLMPPQEQSVIDEARKLGHTPAVIQIPDPIVVLDEPIPMPPDPSELSKDATTEMLTEPK